jgi:hypothetical protein
MANKGADTAAAYNDAKPDRDSPPSVNPLPPRFESYCTGSCSIPTRVQLNCLDDAIDDN